MCFEKLQLHFPPVFDNILTASERGFGKGFLYANLHRSGKDLHLDHVAYTKKREGKIDSYAVDRVSGKLRVYKNGKWISVKNEPHLCFIADG